MSNISNLCKWYELQCVDAWHEDYGAKIDTLDNPGWSLKIELESTSLGERKFEDIKIERNERDWIIARRNAIMFEAFGGPNNLDEMISVFLSWVQ